MPFEKNIQLYNYQTIVIEKQLVEPHKPLPLYGQSKIRHTINAYTTMHNLVRIPFHASDETLSILFLLLPFEAEDLWL